MALSKLSDSELKRLYNDARAGVRQPTDSYDDDGYHEGGYTLDDYYKGDDGGYNFAGGANSSDRTMAQLWKKSGVYKGQYVQNEEDARQGLYKVFDEYDRRQAANKPAPAAPAAKREPPKTPENKSLAIKPVEHSPEISAAREIANSYQAGLKDQKSPWEQAQADANSSSFGAQNQTDFTAQFNPSGSDDTPQMSQETTDMKNKAQDFADKYKLDLISSGATKNLFGS